MPWFSILPPSLNFIETWAIRTFILLGILVIGPWILLLVYDVILFVFRVILYDFPMIGGRARDRPRPRAPTLRIRPGGRPRALSFDLQGVIPTPSSPARKSASGLEEKDGNQQAFYRSRKADVLKDLSKENLPGDIRRNNFLEHAEENGFQFDKRKDLTATMEETGLTAKQIHQLYEKDLIAGDIRYSNGLGDSRARPIPLLEKTPTGLVGMDGSEA